MVGGAHPAPHPAHPPESKGRAQPSMLITVPTEPRPGERLVAATPRTVEKLVRLGYDVAVQSGAGAESNLPDEAYLAAGARICDYNDAWSGDIVTAVNAPGDTELEVMKTG